MNNDERISTFINDNIMPLANSNPIRNTFRTGYAIQVAWTVNSQNAANNTTNLTAKVQLVSLGSSYTIVSSTTRNGTLTINGTSYSFTFSPSLSGNQVKTILTKTVDIPHNSDGTKSVAISTSLGLHVTLSGVYWGTINASDTVTLATIPRTSSFTLGSSSLTLGNSVAVNIAKASASFAHKVWYKFGSINTNIYSGTASSCTLTPSIDDATQIPNATIGTATVTVETYTNTNYTTKIGSTSRTLTINVPTSMKPTIPDNAFTGTGVDSGASYSTFGYVKGKTKCKLTISSATGSYGSTIKSYNISGGGFNSTASSFTTGVLNTAGSITFTATVTDSRGRVSDPKSVTITVNDYFPPIIEFPGVSRSTAEGIPNNDGTYIRVRFESTSAPIVVNKTTYKVEYKTSSSTTWINANYTPSVRGFVFGNGTISTSSSYDVRITVSDTITTVNQVFSVPTAYAILDIKKGGKGIAIGKSAEYDNLVDIGVDMRIHGGLQVGLSGDTFNCNSSTLTYKNNKIYHAGSKPTASEIGALGAKNTNDYWGMTAPDGNDFNWIRTTTTGIIPYSSGTTSSIGTSSWRFSNGYFYTLDLSGPLTIGGDLTGLNSSIYLGNYNTNFRAFVAKRQSSAGQNFQARFGGSYASTKLASTSASQTAYGAVLEATDTSTAQGRYLASNIGFIPLTDNVFYNGTSTYRWAALYASTGTVYSSSKDEKYNIEKIDKIKEVKTISSKESSLTDTILKGLKDVDLYRYKYKTLGVKENEANQTLNDMTLDIEDVSPDFIGFIGQELEETNPDFFNLIGSSYTREDTGDTQYDIRESSLNGVLMVGLQQSLLEIDYLKEKISQLEEKLNNM